MSFHSFTTPPVAADENTPPLQASQANLQADRSSLASKPTPARQHTTQQRRGSPRATMIQQSVASSPRSGRSNLKRKLADINSAAGPAAAPQVAREAPAAPAEQAPPAKKARTGALRSVAHFLATPLRLLQVGAQRLTAGASGSREENQSRSDTNTGKAVASPKGAPRRSLTGFSTGLARRGGVDFFEEANIFSLRGLPSNQA